MINMTTPMVHIYYNGNDKNPVIFIADDEGWILSPSLVVESEIRITIDELTTKDRVDSLLETSDETFELAASLEAQAFEDTINDWINNTFVMHPDMRLAVSIYKTKHDGYNWTRYFRIKETSPGRFRPSVFRKPEYIVQNKPAIVKPKDFFDRVAQTEDLSRQLMNLWEKFVTEHQKIFVEILSQSFDDWMEIYGENTPVDSCMTGENGYDTARFYQLIPEAYPCIIRTQRSIVGRCIVWKVGDTYYQDRIYISSGDYLSAAIEAFRREGIDYVGDARSIVIPINAKQWQRIEERGWIPYMDNFDIAVVEGKGIFLVCGEYELEFDVNDKIRIFNPTHTDGNDFIFRYVDDYYHEIYPEQQ